MITYAFPCVQSSDQAQGPETHLPYQGMTLKDWFAGQIIAAMLGSDPAHSNQRDENGQLCKMNQSKLTNMAMSAY